MTTYTPEQIEEFKQKAEKWDALDKKIEAFYIDDKGEEIPDDESNGLDAIGEVAASAFGWL